MSTITLAPLNKTVIVGASQEFTATVTGAASGATITYAWTVDGTAQSSVTNKMEYWSSVTGTKVIKVVATIKVTDVDDEVIEATTNFIVENHVDVSVVISTTTPEVTVGDQYTVTTKIDPILPTATFTYKWNTGQTTKDITVTATEAGEVELYCDVEMSLPNINDEFLVSNRLKITVKDEEVPIDPADVNYIHPLDHRDSAYLWLGWWVFREIEKAAAAGIDWKTKYDELNYSKDLETLAYMLETYPNVEVQESRNGYILSKSTIESGYIY